MEAQQLQRKNKIIFPGLNSIRAIAALSVVIGHIELLKRSSNIPNLMNYYYFSGSSGHLGVILFFVLSGFLITYLLLDEEKVNHTINWKHFYVRRILRIWPIYFIYIGFAVLATLFFTSERMGSFFYLQIIFYLFFMPNIAFATINGIPHASHLWSIGVEEQFYIVWPLIIHYFRKHILWILIGIAFSFSLIPFLIELMQKSKLFNISNAYYYYFTTIFEGLKFNSMAIGGIGAFLYFSKNKITSYLYHPLTEIFVFSAATFLWYGGFQFPILNSELYSLLFGIIILNIATNPKPRITLNNTILNYLGKISYGIYVYHWLLLEFTIYIAKNYIPCKYSLLQQAFIYICSVSVTITTAHLSYQFIESPILKLKQRFT